MVQLYQMIQNARTWYI